MIRTGVMHVIDTLEIGGAERVAVNLVNLLPRDRYAVHLCTTRHAGPLDALMRRDTGRLLLNRQRALNVGALHTLQTYIKRHDVRILHAHGTSLFIAAAAALLPPFPRVIWHDHSNHHATSPWSTLHYGVPARLACAVMTVTRALAEWAISKLRVPVDRVEYVPNFVCPDDAAVPDLPGTAGSRVVCVANLRPIKDHLTLLRAMAKVHTSAPSAHLLLVGEEADAEYAVRVRQETVSLGIERSVSFLGRRQDVSGILRGSDIGVLSSTSEGLPLALIEYGHAALPAIATRVGECPEVLARGAAGILVPPGNPDTLADALLGLLQKALDRGKMGAAFQAHVRTTFSAEAALARVTRRYESIIETSCFLGPA